MLAAHGADEAKARRSEETEATKFSCFTATHQEGVPQGDLAPRLF